ncbi:DNA polymerase III subunit chi [Calditrichota bacterium]
MADKIIFITLSVANKMRVVCDLIENEYMNGRRVIVNVADESEGKSLDQMLWSWKQSSFIPHAFVPELLDQSDDPVLITDNLYTNLSYDTLILVSPLPVEKFDWFHTVIDFAEKYNPTKIVADRDRFKLYRDKNIILETHNPGEYLHKETA